MRILVTGATGKLGNAVAVRLLERGEQVVALVRDEARARELLPAEVVLAPGDVTDPASLEAAAAGIDAAVNCMGIFEQWVRDPDVFNRVNAQGALAVVRAARLAGAKRVVHTSTFDVFDVRAGGTVDEDAVADYEKRTPYERSKQLAERLVLAEAERGVEVVLVNPAAIYGPGPWAAAGPDSMLRDAIRGRLPLVPPGGMSLAWVDDVAGAHLAALDRGRPGERYAVADGYAELAEICAAAIAVAGRGRVPRTMPLPLARALAAAGETLARLTGVRPLLGRGQLEFLLWGARVEAKRCRRELGIEPLPWREGIERTVAWMEAAGRLRRTRRR
jgi:dihydroflavonol-4-reductase